MFYNYRCNRLVSILYEQAYVRDCIQKNPASSSIICLSLIPLSHWSRPTKLGEPGGNVDQASAKRDQVGVLWSEAGPPIEELRQRLQRFMTELRCQQLVIFWFKSKSGWRLGKGHGTCLLCGFLLVRLQWDRFGMPIDVASNFQLFHTKQGPATSPNWQFSNTSNVFYIINSYHQLCFLIIINH